MFREFFGASAKPLGVTILATPTASLTLYVDGATTVYAGQPIVFKGSFTRDGGPLPNEKVALLKDGAYTGLSGLTDYNGAYSITWDSDVPGSYTFQTEAIDPPLPPPTGTEEEPTKETNDETDPTASYQKVKSNLVNVDTGGYNMVLEIMNKIKNRLSNRPRLLK